MKMSTEFDDIDMFELTVEWMYTQPSTVTNVFCDLCQVTWELSFLNSYQLCSLTQFSYVMMEAVLLLCVKGMNIGNCSVNQDIDLSTQYKLYCDFEYLWMMIHSVSLKK